ncbi:phage tail assembly protein [Zooshikella harenae]|uniref:Phage tail assembly protein n=1 Tax=Zooshikella harenae TaxID=2827238 RepID=A0ABS5ZK04_9GAMM|nr:phage tail assembly protein [Zooshikella harenae]MBU2714223.1 phage tail assembly protein [Zooshikella harenae]
MSQIYTLEYPINVNGEVVSEIKLRRPTVKDMKNTEKQGGGDFEQAIALIASLSGISQQDIENIDGADFKKINNLVVDKFFRH